ncbi:MAG: VOC family protein [Proteobacteria bacterium]|nr:VOC family protein [Pseudomonadota bacterium]MDA1301809.1 VOC family protein [Pseudomonadota bacterium]
MIRQTDRLALAVPDADQAAADLNALFDSVIIDDRHDPAARARRVTLQWGTDQLELFEPTEDGPVSEFIGEGKRGLFAGGFACDDPATIASGLESAGVPVAQEGDRFTVFPADLSGTGIILSPLANHQRVGLNDRLWQITYTVPGLAEDVARYRTLLGLTDAFTSYYDSEVWGYHAAITWFDSQKGGALDSLEFLEPFDHGKAAGRFLARSGGEGGIYMASVQTDDIFALRDRVMSTGGGWEASPKDEYTGFIHPRRTHGLLLGVVTYSRFDARKPTPEDPDAWG